MSAVRKPSKPPPHRSPAPEDCGCGSGLAPTLEVPLSRGRRACSRCYDDQRRFYYAEAYPSGGAEHGDDPTSGSGWHYSRNPPQRYTVTEGGRRVRLAGGNVFPSKGEAQRAVQFLRATEGGDYRVRAIKPGESVGRVAAVNGKKSACSRKKRGATGVRRVMRNPEHPRLYTTGEIERMRPGTIVRSEAMPGFVFIKKHSRWFILGNEMGAPSRASESRDLYGKLTVESDPSPQQLIKTLASICEVQEYESGGIGPLVRVAGKPSKKFRALIDMPPTEQDAIATALENATLENEVVAIVAARVERVSGKHVVMDEASIGSGFLELVFSFRR